MNDLWCTVRLISDIQQQKWRKTANKTQENCKAHSSYTLKFTVLSWVGSWSGLDFYRSWFRRCFCVFWGILNRVFWCLCACVALRFLLRFVLILLRSCLIVTDLTALSCWSSSTDPAVIRRRFGFSLLAFWWVTTGPVLQKSLRGYTHLTVDQKVKKAHTTQAQEEVQEEQHGGVRPPFSAVKTAGAHLWGKHIDGPKWGETGYPQ